MDSDKIKEIAAHSGASVSTVRRVLGHCSGITDETRTNVIRSQCTLSHPDTDTNRRVFFVLPDNPKAFWHQALTVLNGHPFNPPVKLSFYSSLQQQTALTNYLQPVLQERDTALILAASLTDEQRELVSQIAKHNLVIQLCERSAVDNTVYVGADAYREGYDIGKRVTATRIAIVRRAGNFNVGERIRGFTDAVGHIPVVTVEEPTDRTLYASLLARELHALSPAPDLVFCPGGYATETCQAIYKLHATTPMRCITWEHPKTNDRTIPLLTAVATQTLADQTRTALQLAAAFVNEGTRPAQNEYIHPSRITYYK